MKSGRNFGACTHFFIDTVILHDLNLLVLWGCLNWGAIYLSSWCKKKVDPFQVPEYSLLDLCGVLKQRIE